ncbi:two-component regulator propeller domain-containing protein [Fulvivirga sp.]|uniref:two-component regulator propeller domain-containing protein n=1 Tax=Fulvivirga sp. TaxID=1931237 RepID=UPI0032F0544E
MGKLLASILFFATLSSFGQNQVRFDRITVEDGLSQSSIKSLVQDKFGYLWVGTLDGLNKYDGNKFYQYHHREDVPGTIPRNNIHRLFIDGNQNLWVSSPGYLSLYVQEENNFTSYSITIDNKSDSEFIVHELYQESDSILLLGTNKGIWNFNLSSGQFKRNALFAQFDNDEVKNFIFNDTGKIWVVTSQSIYAGKRTAGIFEKLFSFDNRISVHHSKASDEAYLHTYDSLCKFDFEANRIKTIYKFSEADLIGEQRMPMLKLTNGELWVMRKKVFIFNSEETLTKTLSYVQQDPFALSSEYLACIYETKDGVLWIGTNGMGLNKYSPQLSVFNYFAHFPEAPVSLSNNFVTSVSTKDDNIIYVSTIEGLDVIDQKAGKTSHYEIVSQSGVKSRVNSMLLVKEDKLWLATSHGLQLWNGKGIEIINDNNGLGSHSTNVDDLFSISSTQLVIASNKGIFLFDTDTNISKELSPTGTATMKLIGNTLWAENYNSIVVYDTSTYLPTAKFEVDPKNINSFPSAAIKCFYKDAEGKVWIGTHGAGLVLYDPKQNSFKSFTEKDGLPNSVIYGILEDKEANLWLSTNKGIAVFNRNQLRCTRSFNTNHGLQGNEFNTNAFFQSPSGIMYFGGVNGLTSFRPEEAIRLASDIPKAIIAGLFVNGARKDEVQNGQLFNQIVNDSKMELAWNERNFGFEISSLGFSYPAQTSYQYILEGYDDNWTFIENERRIQFTNIPPGYYTLRIKASNSFGEWENQGLALAINIKPPIWRTGWFILLVIAALLGTIYAIFKYRTRALRNQTLLLEELVDDRTRELQVQQEEIQAANEELTAQSELMDHRNAELEKVKSSLEERVAERTITLQKLNHDLVDQNTKLEQFAFITAHNIRGPVAQIKGLINLLRTDDSEVLNLLTSSANDLDQVISDLTLVLSIRKGMGNLIEPVELKSQLMLAVKMLKDEIGNVKGTVDISQFKMVYINGLHPYAYSIFYNLIHNALKYSSPERPVVITCSNTLSDDGKVKIIVEDNGIGIDMNYAEDKIFNLYQRFHPEKIGKGFGLFLTRTHVEAMKGSIEVESTLNIGTRFIMEFPISKEAVLKAT